MLDLLSFGMTYKGNRFERRRNLMGIGINAKCSKQAFGEMFAKGCFVRGATFQLQLVCGLVNMDERTNLKSQQHLLLPKGSEGRGLRLD